MELFWTPEAVQDRNAIYDYIEADNPVSALALDELFAEKAGRLIDPCLSGCHRQPPDVVIRDFLAYSSA